MNLFSRGILFLLISGLPLLGKQFVWPSLDSVVAQAKQGDLDARIELADRSLDYIGESFVPREIVNSFSDGIAAGRPNAYAGMARCYYEGIGVEKHAHQAFRLARRAVELEAPKGYRMMAELHLLGDPVKKDYLRAKELFEEGAERGDLIATFWRAALVLEENSFSKNHSQPEILEALAEAGLELAIDTLALKYRNQDQEKAKHYGDLALKHGSVDYLLKVADYGARKYDFKKSVEENRFASECFRRVAQKGHPRGIHRLGELLSYFPSLAQEGEDWEKLLQHGVETGNLESIDVLANFYFKPWVKGRLDQWKTFSRK